MEKSPNNKQKFDAIYGIFKFPTFKKKTAAPEDVPWESLDQYLRRVVHPKNPHDTEVNGCYCLLFLLLLACWQTVI